jgi:hypothetical protein
MLKLPPFSSVRIGPIAKSVLVLLKQMEIGYTIAKQKAMS